MPETIKPLMVDCDPCAPAGGEIFMWETHSMYGPYGIVGVILVVILVIVLLRLLGLI
jgi:hypothetical protein